MYKYIYKNKSTGRKVYSNHKLDSKFLVLDKEMRNGNIKSNNVIQK